MGFKIRNTAKEWFKHIRKKDGLETDFDVYYFCLMAGLVANQKEMPKDVTEFIDYFPGNYNNSGKLLVSLLLKTELDRLGVDLSEKKNVREVIKRLVSTNTRTYLSDEGMKLMDSYSYAGFDVIREAFHTDPPRSLEIFLPRMKNLLQEKASK